VDKGQVITLIVVAVVAAVLAVVLVKFLDRLRKKDAESEAKDIVLRAERERTNRLKEAELEIKERAIQQQGEVEKELNKSRQALHERERSLDKRQDMLDQQNDQLRKQEKMVEGTQRKLTEKIEETNRLNEDLTTQVGEQRQALHRIANLGPDEAKTLLLERLDRELRHEQGQLILEREKELAKVCEAKARDVLLTSLQRYAAAHTAETTTSTVDIPNDEMKGRIIGREGRNIRTFEKACGVDVIIDDTPGVVIVSGFDPVRRETARLALGKLIADGRIHPSRIEEVVAETQQEMEGVIRKHGEEAAHEADVPNLQPRILDLLGRLRFRTSYSQNVLRHSIEVAFLSGMMAEEVGLDGELARRAGLLHDIGKAADHETEGGHPQIGADLLKRHNEGPEVVHAALGHHDDIRVDHPYTVIVAAADACSASRPGARRETLERYIKRMEELESIAMSFAGVEQAYAIQAGRELRVIANSKDTSDASAAKIGYDIARAYEQRLTYPGEIKVTVVRETRHQEIAR